MFGWIGNVQLLNASLHSFLGSRKLNSGVEKTKYHDFLCIGLILFPGLCYISNFLHVYTDLLKFSYLIIVFYDNSLM